MIPTQKNSKPVFILHDGERKVAITDGSGNAYWPIGDYRSYDGPLTNDNLIPEGTYEFDRFLTGFDF